MRFHFQSIFCASLLVVLASQGQSLVHSQDVNKSVRIQFRDASLEDRSSEDRTLEDLVSDSGPETIRYSEAQLTSENVQSTQAAPKRVTRLGMRDDANADTYNVSGRGVSKPEGKRTGRYCMNGMERAGFPWLPGSHARPGNYEEWKNIFLFLQLPPAPACCCIKIRGAFSPDWTIWFFSDFPVLLLFLD